MSAVPRSAMALADNKPDSFVGTAAMQKLTLRYKGGEKTVIVPPTCRW